MKIYRVFGTSFMFLSVWDRQNRSWWEVQDEWTVCAYKDKNSAENHCQKLNNLLKEKGWGDTTKTIWEEDFRMKSTEDIEVYDKNFRKHLHNCWGIEYKIEELELR